MLAAVLLALSLARCLGSAFSGDSVGAIGSGATAAAMALLLVSLRQRRDAPPAELTSAQRRLAFGLIFAGGGLMLMVVVVFVVST